LFGLAATHHDRGSFDEAEALFQDALADYDTSFGKPHPMAATALLNIGMIRRLREQYVSAEPLLASAVSMRSALFEPDHPEVIEAIANWGIELTELGRLGEAERVLTDGLQRANTALGPNHPYASTLREELASVWTAKGRYRDAIVQFDTSLAAKRERFGKDHPQLVFGLIRSAQPQIEGGHLTEADSLLNAALAMGQRLSPGSRGVSTLLAVRGLARIATERESYRLADSLLAEALSIADAQLRPNHRYRLALERERSALLLATGRASETIGLLEGVLSDELAVRPQPHIRIGTTQQLMGEAFLATGDPIRAEQMLLEAAANFTELPDWHWQVGLNKSLLGAALLKQGRRDEARPLLQEGHSTISAHLGSQARAARAARTRLDIMENESPG
jgi:tetratricopeptide (TPR) repeat protein